MIKASHQFGLVLAAALLLTVVSARPLSAAAIDHLYLIPFSQGSAPQALADTLFDSFAERLYEAAEQRGMTLTIVKQELTDADVAAFADKHYLIGDIATYSADKGCCYTELKLQGRVQLTLPGGARQPIIELDDELFFNHDITPLAEARDELAQRLGQRLADRLLARIAAD